MNSTHLFFTNLYKNFNDRKIELVIAEMAENVIWANGKLLADDSVLHIFHLENNKITRFDIGGLSK